MHQSCLRKTIKKIKRKSSKIKGKNTLESRKSRLWPLVSTLSIFLKKKKKDMILMRSCILTTIKKAILLVIVLNQKTSIGFDNLCSSN